MANKAISELPQAQNVNNQDLFVLEQSGIAKKLTAETFITEQGIIDALAEALDGHGGIASVTLSSVSGRIRTYLITFTDETTTTFQVLDGTSIDRIEKTSTAGLVDTYTIFMSDGTTSFFQVSNGSNMLDRTLTMSDAAAPADLVGDLKSAIAQLDGKLLDGAVKSAILDCFENVVWASADGETAYNNLKDIFSENKWHIINNLTNCENSNTATTITKGANYTATITSVSATALESAVVSITMGGVDITASVYNHGEINIPNVTGNVQITITIAEGYTLHGYIAQTGVIPNNNGIITDIALSTDYTFETSVLYNNTSGTLYPMMGTRVGSSTKQFALYVQPSTTRLAYWFSGTDSSTYITGLNSNVKNEIIVKPVGTSTTYPNNAVIELNETEYNTTSTATNVTFSPWFTLFGYGQSASTSANMGNIQLRIGETIVKSGNTVIYDLIPAYNGEKYGFYELINDKFYFGADATLYTGGDW